MSTRKPAARVYVFDHRRKDRLLDLGLRTVNLTGKGRLGLGWTTDLNVTWNRNVVTELYDGQPITATVSSRITSIAAVGQPLGEFYLYRFLRVDPQTGNAVYAKAGGGETLSELDQAEESCVERLVELGVNT